MNSSGHVQAAIRWGFSSMGAPELTLSETLALAAEFGLDFVELRSLEKSLDLPAVLAAYDPQPAPASFPVPVVLVASSLQLIEATEDDIAAFLRFAEAAVQVGARYVRVFGGGTWGRKLDPEQLEHARKVVATCRKRLAHAAPGVRMILETHSAFSSASACQRLNHALGDAGPLEILWDSHHTWRLAREDPEETWALVGPLVRHIHYKDSCHALQHVSRSSYVLPGKGEYPGADLFQMLVRERYAGGFSLEWERLWHADLPPLREALAAFRDRIAEWTAPAALKP